MKDWGKDIGDSLTLGFELVLPTIFFAFLGYKVDGWFSSFPAGLVVGVFLGASLGFWSVVRKFLAGPDKTERR